MRQKISFISILSLSLSLFLVSCTSIEIEDHEWCLDAVDEAFCFHTVSENERDVTKADWDTLRRGRISGTQEAFASLKATILKLCELTKKCQGEAAQKIETFFTKVEVAKVKQKVSETNKIVHPKLEVNDGPKR